MAKVDLKLYSEYERIQKEYNKMRKRVTKKILRLRDEITSGRIPSLVVPQRRRKIPLRTAMKMSRRMLRQRMRELYRFVTHFETDLYRSIKQGYLELYRTYIIQEDTEYNPFANKYPDREGFLYSEEQIKLETNPKLAQFMRDYNMIVRMNPERFATLLYTGKLPSFQKLYEEFSGKGFSFGESWADQLHEAIRLRAVKEEDMEDVIESRQHYVENEKRTKYYVRKEKQGVKTYKNKHESKE